MVIQPSEMLKDFYKMLNKINKIQFELHDIKTYGKAFHLKTVRK